MRTIALPYDLVKAFSRVIPDSFTDYLINLVCFDLEIPLSFLRRLERAHVGKGQVIMAVNMPSDVMDKVYEAVTRYHPVNWIVEHLMCSDPVIIEALGDKASWITTKPYVS